jgi:hypothetical protein
VVPISAVPPGTIGTELFCEHNPPGSEGETGYRAMVPMGHPGGMGEIVAPNAMRWLTFSSTRLHRLGA